MNAISSETRVTDIVTVRWASESIMHCINASRGLDLIGYLKQAHRSRITVSVVPRHGKTLVREVFSLAHECLTAIRLFPESRQHWLIASIALSNAEKKGTSRPC